MPMVLKGTIGRRDAVRNVTVAACVQRWVLGTEAEDDRGEIGARLGASDPGACRRAVILGPRPEDPAPDGPPGSGVRGRNEGLPTCTAQPFEPFRPGYAVVGSVYPKAVL